MRGRTKYQLARPLLAVAALALRLCPRTVCGWLLVMLRHVPTGLGIALRYALVRRLARRCGECVAIFEGVYLYHLANAEFGDNISIHPMCYLDAAGGLTIGSDVSIAHATTIMTTEHDYRGPWKIREGPAILAKVAIGSDVWLGCGVRVLAGVAISAHVVVGAGAVVTRDIPPDSLALGVPARVARSINLKEETQAWIGSRNGQN